MTSASAPLPALSPPSERPITRRQAVGAGTLALLLTKADFAWGATILAVRVWPADDYTRVTIESDGKLTTKQLFVTTPPRLAVDIEGVELSPELRELVGRVKPNDPYISGIRVGQNTPGVVRLVIDLKQAALPQVFNLAPVAAYQHRLVLDLYPTLTIDPLAALINERLNETPATTLDTPSPKPSAATSAARDPLGELPSKAAAPNRPAPQTPAPQPPAPPMLQVL
jgi:N-acetylmuramoyl-L-alanine amidase